ncbi:unnamed protein product [Enterobius vermicularis]|uniref:Uncharacterized protein n=1 Tax=Enterobius vermicularis TaxID=51028 RepID=A0A3P6IQS5_ENTVE|nr:unnamed protein product [Enterobius vermicularis]
METTAAPVLHTSQPREDGKLKVPPEILPKELSTSEPLEAVTDETVAYVPEYVSGMPVEEAYTPAAKTLKPTILTKPTMIIGTDGNPLPTNEHGEVIGPDDEPIRYNDNNEPLGPDGETLRKDEQGNYIYPMHTVLQEQTTSVIARTAEGTTLRTLVLAPILYEDGVLLAIANNGTPIHADGSTHISQEALNEILQTLEPIEVVTDKTVPHIAEFASGVSFEETTLATAVHKPTVFTKPTIVVDIDGNPLPTNDHGEAFGPDGEPLFYNENKEPLGPDGETLKKDKDGNFIYPMHGHTVEVSQDRTVLFDGNAVRPGKDGKVTIPPHLIIESKYTPQPIEVVTDKTVPQISEFASGIPTQEAFASAVTTLIPDSEKKMNIILDLDGNPLPTNERGEPLSPHGELIQYNENNEPLGPDGETLTKDKDDNYIYPVRAFPEDLTITSTAPTTAKITTLIKMSFKIFYEDGIPLSTNEDGRPIHADGTTPVELSQENEPLGPDNKVLEKNEEGNYVWPQKSTDVLASGVATAKSRLPLSPTAEISSEKIAIISPTTGTAQKFVEVILPDKEELRLSPNEIKELPSGHILRVFDDGTASLDGDVIYPRQDGKIEIPPELTTKQASTSQPVQVIKDKKVDQVPEVVSGIVSEHIATPPPTPSISVFASKTPPIVDIDGTPLPINEEGEPIGPDGQPVKLDEDNQPIGPNGETLKKDSHGNYVYPTRILPQEPTSSRAIPLIEITTTRPRVIPRVIYQDGVPLTTGSDGSPIHSDGKTTIELNEQNQPLGPDNNVLEKDEDGNYIWPQKSDDVLALGYTWPSNSQTICGSGSA